ncbi:hypothetical protein DOY81_007622 [Sarcophaga bullata]|nr:hypothetical protein DOY81_007622 [Sarcophaga bullata]
MSKQCVSLLNTDEVLLSVLSSKEGGFGIVMDSEDEMNTWLNHLLILQRSLDTHLDFPQFDYVWQVIIQKKGIAEQHSLFGSYHICLTNKSITFIKIGREKNFSDKKITRTEILLTTIRRCGDSQCYFYMEIGRQSTVGPGELWMETEDSLTAQNMHSMILSKMITLNESLEPMRKRSSSATETSNNDRKPTKHLDISSNYIHNVQSYSRDRCDSLPSRNRTSSECSNHSVRVTPTTSVQRVINFHISNTSPITCSASEESVSVDDSEECLGVTNILSSRSPEGVIPEECVDDTFHLHSWKNTNDVVEIKPEGHTGMPNKTNVVMNISTEGQLQPVRAYSFGNKSEMDKTTESLTNRVRAFSVGSRVKITRPSFKANPRVFNSDSIKNDFAVNSSRKSISVPVLINKNDKSVNQMADLMEIDFSKSVKKTSSSYIHQHKTGCHIGHFPTRNLDNSIESLQKGEKGKDTGYLEMKPITLNNCSCNINTEKILQFKEPVHINPKDRDLKTDLLSNADNKHVSSCSIEPSTETTHINHDLNSLDNTKFNHGESSFLNQDLYYASLDLPKNNNEVASRYNFKEIFTDTNTEQVRNEYAKINFNLPDMSSCKLRNENN